jgi:hypothetical protein
MQTVQFHQHFHARSTPRGDEPMTVNNRPYIEVYKSQWYVRYSLMHVSRRLISFNPMIFTRVIKFPRLTIALCLLLQSDYRSDFLCGGCQATAFLASGLINSRASTLQPAAAAAAGGLQ